MSYEFDDGFQTKIAALSLRDATFSLRAEGLIEPGYFSNEAEASLVALTHDYWAKYKALPSPATLVRLLTEAITKKVVRSDMVDEIKAAFRTLMKADISDRDYVIDEIAAFARHQAIIAAMEKSVALLDKRDFDAIELACKQAFQVGANDGGVGHDLLADIDVRSERRKEEAAGVIKRTITSGCRQLDSKLAGGGFGRKELTVLMGGAKRGKCVTRDTLVLTEDGLVEIGDYVPTDMPADTFLPFEREILGRDGVERTSHVYNNGRSETFRVTTRRGYRIEGTPNHPMLVVNEIGEHAWRNLEDVRKGDHLVVQRGRRIFGSSVDLSSAVKAASRYSEDTPRGRTATVVKLPNSMTPDLAEFLAMLVAEGCLLERDALVSFTQKCDVIFDRYLSLLENLFGVPVAINHREGSKEARVYSRMLQVYLTELGLKPEKSALKEIPISIRKAPEACVIAFTSALMGLEGSVVTTSSGKISYHLTMASERLIRQLHTLLTNFGIVSSLRLKRSCATNGSRIMRDYWDITVRGQRNLATLSQIGLYERRKQEALENGLTGVDTTARDRIPNSAGKVGEIMAEIQAAGISLKSNLSPTWYRMLRMFRSNSRDRVLSRAFAEELVVFLHKRGIEGPASDWLRGVLKQEYAYDNIVAITRSEAETVDFTVPDTHSFFANGLISHNSFGLVNFGLGAALAGHNVLHISLENSEEVTTDRADSFLSGFKTKDLLKHIDGTSDAIKLRLAKAGHYIIHEYPTGTFAPRDLRRLLERYRTRGIAFDEIVVDYWDIMAPDAQYRDDKIAESASIGMGLRGIAKEENAAVVTAIQTNREGFKAHTAMAEHAAEDFNKVRLADLLMSINSDADERAAGQARIYITEARNTAGGTMLSITQDLSRAIFIDKVVSDGEM